MGILWPIRVESLVMKRRYTAHEKELVVIHCFMSGLWRHYLLGQRFLVNKDNTVVRHYLSQPELNARQARWQEKLAKFDVAFRV